MTGAIIDDRRWIIVADHEAGGAICEPSGRVRRFLGGAEVTTGDVDRMKERLFLTTADARSAFWVLLVLAAVIAAAGVVADSVATVIGAMIVAPLMTPILGTALAVVLADHRQLVRSAGLVLAGAAAVVLVGFLLGLVVQNPVVAASDDQVAGRIAPKLIDLLAALATGGVGAFALVRSDVSDALPGVAIAISLVPPLAVVGLTVESGAPDEALGALLRFGTNVTAIIATGIIVLLAYRIRAVAAAGGLPVGRLSGRTLVVIAGLVVLVAVPLTIGSARIIQQEATLASARPAVQAWARDQSLTVATIDVVQGELRVAVVGARPPSDDGALRALLDGAGLPALAVRLSTIEGVTDRIAPAPG